MLCRDGFGSVDTNHRPSFRGSGHCQAPPLTPRHPAAAGMLADKGLHAGPLSGVCMKTSGDKPPTTRNPWHDILVIGGSSGALDPMIRLVSALPEGYRGSLF